MPWDPERYHQFQKERFAPFDDLLAMVRVRERLRVVDLGCGTGELTRRLADALPGSTVVGIDSSPQMLARAQAQERPGLSFVEGRIEDVSGQWDLVFSHAAIQWVGDHQHLVPRLLDLVAPGGQLAVQLPSNHQHPTHLVIQEIAGQEPFCTALEGWIRTVPMLPLERYAELLFEYGTVEMIVFEKVYGHVMENAGALADWVSGTALVPYFERLGEDLREAFLARYRSRLEEIYPVNPVFYPFRRILFSALKPS